MISGAIARARASSSASDRLAIGCGMDRNLYSGTPQDWAMAWPVPSNTSVTMDAAGHHHVHAAGGLVEDLLVRGDARVVLAPHLGLGGPVLLLEDLADLQQQPVRVELGVLHQPDPLALEGIRARHVGQRLTPRLDRGVEDLEARHHALLSLMTTVTASDEVRPPQPGM